jgi:hypothetical protein
VYGWLARRLTLCHSEKSDEENSDQMEVDEQVGKKKNKEDLSEYRLDDYDKDSAKKSEAAPLKTAQKLMKDRRRYLFEHKGTNILQG